MYNVVVDLYTQMYNSKHNFTPLSSEDPASPMPIVSALSVKLDSDVSGRAQCIKELEVKVFQRQRETTVVGHVTTFSTYIRISLMERGLRPSLRNQDVASP